MRRTSSKGRELQQGPQLCFFEGQRHLAAKARELQAILYNRLTPADVDRVLEMPRTAHPSLPNGVQNEPNLPAAPAAGIANEVENRSEIRRE